MLCQALNKLFLPPETDDDDKVRTLKASRTQPMYTLTTVGCLGSSCTCQEFDSALSKRFEKQLEDFNESEYRQLQSLQELFKFLDNIMPLDEDEDGDEEEEASAAKKRAARKRRSESVTSDATSITDEWTATPPRGKSGKAKSKRGR